MNSNSSLAKVWANADRPGIRAFFLSLAALTLALLLALYSGAAAEMGQRWVAGVCAITALLLAGWVAITLVPVLARRTSLRWLGYRLEYKITREGWIYIAGIFAVAAGALNTGNNLLFLILACLIALILMSGILSSITLSGVEMRIELPEHIFAGQPVRAAVELLNQKRQLPSFSLRVEGITEKGRGKKPAEASAALLERPVYFPYIGRHGKAKQIVPLLFPRRGVYRQEAFRVVTRFPFGFLQKARRVNLVTEALVYPSVEPQGRMQEMLPSLEGALESARKGYGHDLYALREYQPADSVRHVHWKASARSGSLMVREFSRESDRRILLVFDPAVDWNEDDANAAQLHESFERGVTLCASLAWHFAESGALLEFRAPGIDLPLSPARDLIFDVLAALARVNPVHEADGPGMLARAPIDPSAVPIVFTGRPESASALLSDDSRSVFHLDQL